MLQNVKVPLIQMILAKKKKMFSYTLIIHNYVIQRTHQKKMISFCELCIPILTLTVKNGQDLKLHYHK
jgi:hypothetical protein